MKKFEKEVRVGNFEDEGKEINFLFGLLDARLNGDWSEYKVGEEVEYVWNGDEWKLEIEDEDGDLNDGDLSVEELKEFVGEGICVIEDSNEDLWYNIKFEGEDLVIGFVELDIKF